MAAHESTHGHHRVHVLDLAGKPGKQVQLPLLFSAPYRPDIIQRAVVAAQANRWQPYGSDPYAGTRRSVVWPGKGRGMARTPRVKTSNRGGFVPNTVSGREAHPPRAVKDRGKKINAQERRRALASALAATREVELAMARGHTFPNHVKLPLVIEDDFEGIESTQRAKEVLTSLGVYGDVLRAQNGTHVRPGKGKGRGRPRRVPRSLLIVVSKPGVARGFRNLKGVDIVPVVALGTEDLAPGGQAGRLTLYSSSSLKLLEERFGRTVPVTSIPALPPADLGGKAA